MTAFRLSTAELPPSERFGAWYEVMASEHVPMVLDSEHRADFRATAELWDFGPMQVSRLSYPAMSGRRTERLIRRADPELLLVSLTTHGQRLTQLPDREWATPIGGIDVYDTSRPAAVINPGPVSHLVLQLPRSAVVGRGRMGNRLRNMSLSADGGIGGVLAYIVEDLARNGEDHHPEVTNRLYLTIIDLLTAAARLADDARGSTPPESVGRVRFAQIQRYLLARLGDPTLTPGGAATALGLSARQFNRVFQNEGATPAEWIRRQRLDRCRRDLLDPGRLDQPVVQVGARWGFPDPTSFNRAFRREFGMPPGEYRRRHDPAHGSDPRSDGGPEPDGEYCQPDGRPGL